MNNCTLTPEQHGKLAQEIVEMAASVAPSLNELLAGEYILIRRFEDKGHVTAMATLVNRAGGEVAPSDLEAFKTSMNKAVRLWSVGL